MKGPRKVFVITGAGIWIGRELARQLVIRGARVAAVDRRAEGLANLAYTPAARTWLSTHVIDVTDRDAVEALPAEVEAVHGAVDGLVNNAGIIQPFLPVIELDDGATQRVLEVNLMGTLNMVRAFLPLLIARPEAQVVNVASMGASSRSRARRSTAQARPGSRCSARAYMPSCWTRACGPQWSSLALSTPG